MLKPIVRFIVLGLGLATCAAANAQNYPSSPISIAVPTPPGGPMDTMMRVLAAKMAENIGQQVIIENKTGGGGIIATQSALRTPADGYSVAGIYLSHATNVHIYPKLPYDTLKDLTPVILVAKGPLVLLVNKDVPVNSVAELIAYAKANPGKLNIGASALGGASHLGGELFKAMAGVDMQMVPYKGTTALIPDILEGRVQVTIDSYLQYLPYAKTGAIRMLGVSSANRIDVDSSIPAIAETLPGYETLAWWGLAVSSTTPADIVSRLNKEAARALENIEVKQKIGVLGIVPGGGTPAEFSMFIRSEIAKWESVIKNAGLVEK
jgi:tripartite-type tricarboxylate transporter receptor subunit TctC